MMKLLILALLAVVTGCSKPPQKGLMLMWDGTQVYSMRPEVGELKDGWAKVTFYAPIGRTITVDIAYTQERP